MRRNQPPVRESMAQSPQTYLAGGGYNNGHDRVDIHVDWVFRSRLARAQDERTSHGKKVRSLARLFDQDQRNYIDMQVLAI